MMHRYKPRVLTTITIYPQSVCSENDQFELCSKCNREHDFDVTLDESYLVARCGRGVVDMSQALK